MTAPRLMKTAMAPAISSAGNRHEITCSRAYHCNSANASWSEFPQRGASNGTHSAAMNAAVSNNKVRPSVRHSNGMADLLLTSIGIAIVAPEIGALPRPVGEIPEPLIDGLEVAHLRHAGYEVIDHAARPARQTRIEPIKDAVGDPRVFDDVERAEYRQMPQIG